MRNVRFYALVASLVLGFGLAACSSDAGSTGDSGTDTVGTGADGNGGSLGDGTGSTDGVGGADGTAGTDGNAGSDVEADTGALADTAGTADTGSTADTAGTTDTGSTADTAGTADAGGAKDTGGGGGGTNELLACLTKECQTEVSACFADSDCLKAVGCLGGCNGDTTCMLGCGNGLSSSGQQALLAAGQCGMQKGCINLGGGGGGGGGSKCGDGTCDLGEQLTCPQDCPNPCGDGKCDLGEQFLCPQDCGGGGGGGGGAKCGDGTCDAPAENPFTCTQDCKAPVCGDGSCDLPFETTLTCAPDCGAGSGTLPTCGDGKCESPIENPFVCAGDCPAPKCGDGTCDSPWETSLTCTADCSGGGGGGGGNIDMTSCLLNQCGSESLACTTDFTGCLQAGLCVGQCKDMSCVAACGDKLTGGAADKFKTLRDCIQSKCAP